MANQITHIVLAEKIANKLYTKFDRRQFLVGTVFPDIRYLKIIDRETTHSHGLTLTDILQEQNSFLAGMKYHSLVDEVRENFIRSKDTYALIPSSKFITQALKTYEDEILYSKVTDWNEIGNFLATPLGDELRLVNQKDQVERWNSVVRAYLETPPTDETRENFGLGIGLPKDIVIEINTLITKMRDIPEVKKIILELYEQWESLISIK